MTVYFPKIHLTGLLPQSDPLEFEISSTAPVPMVRHWRSPHAEALPHTRGSTRMFEQLFSSNPLPMWVYEENTHRFLEVNQAALEKYGYSRDEFLSMSLWDIRPPSEHETLTRHLQGDHQEGPDSQVWLHQKKNGELLEVQINSHSFVYRHQPARLVMIHDVTERNRIQRALEDSENRFRLIAENTVNLIMTFDARYQPTYVSPSVEGLLGYTPEEFMSIPEYGYIHPDDVEGVRAGVMGAVEAGKAQHILEYRIQHKGGHHLWCETAFKLVWHEGKFQGFISSSLDITDRVQDRERLLASLNTSSGLVHLAEALEQATEPEEVIGLALKHCLEVLRFDYGMFIQLHEHQYTVRETRGIGTGPAHELLDRYLRSTGPRLLQAFLSRTPVFFGADEALCHPAEALPRPGARELAVLPIHVDGQLYGFLVFGTVQDQVQFGENTIRILRAVRDRISHAFERNLYIEKLSSSREETLRAIGLVLEYRDYETKGHTDRVVQLSDQLGRQMGLSGADLDALRWGAYLHDTGKIAIPDHILLKPGRLSPEEFEQVKKHSEIGFEMLRHIPSLPPATLDVILHHHEKWDGKGYPSGLRGYSIPLSARIFTVVDVYDALVSRRPYKEPMSHEEAMTELRRCAGSMFDPEVVSAFETLMQGLQTDQLF